MELQMLLLGLMTRLKVVILLWVLVHNLHPLFKPRLHLHNLNQFAHLKKLVYDFALTKCFFTLFLAAFLRFHLSLKMLGVNSYVLRVEVGEPVEAELCQLPEPVEATGNIYDHVVVKQEDF